MSLVDEKSGPYLIYSGSSNINRPDLVSGFKMPGLENAGFSVTANISSVPKGVYKLQIAGDFDDRISVCAPDRLIEVQ